MGCWRSLVAVAVLVGCTKHNPSATCPDGICSDPAHPYCDADGVISGDPGSCIAVSCTPGSFQACDGSSELVCDSSGSNYTSVACSDGCTDASGCHIPHLVPKYLPNACDAPAAMAALDFSSSGMFDPNLDTNCSGGVVAQPGGPSICVVHAGTITIEANNTITVINTNEGTGRTVAFVSDSDLDMEGTLDVGAKGSLNGPGAILQNNLALSGVGLGGAGAATAGGSGGNATETGGAMNAGAQSLNPALLSALVGGQAASQLDQGPPMGIIGGGGGGGAATLISCRGTVMVSGTLTAGGGGGTGGAGLVSGGMGGGAGGNLVIQGMNVEVVGQAFANGGGGGAGERADSMEGENGSDGTPSATTAARGGLANDGEGAGGAGGVGIGTPEDGRNPTNASAHAGGGGGSVGFLQTYTPAGVTPTLTPAHVSPPFQPNGTVPTK